ncbi:histidine triad nucleotide-binding protein [uncultured Brachyspira sp.]|uniref:histidine triad nucleotide-binding protein n=1 Tax=uncultured Brachyspira sp. TaxID=221953 RepID=UPI0025F63230|nr:histidine triad nucleotide-binding protein [uncultured Brachyspira sp.]
MSNDCIFCKIVKGEIPSKFIKENEYCVVFNDLNPKSDVHLLVVPKKHLKDITEIDNDLMGKVLDTIKEVAKENNLESFRIVNNCGENAGQSVFHLHFHVLSGKNLKDNF